VAYRPATAKASWNFDPAIRSPEFVRAAAAAAPGAPVAHGAPWDSTRTQALCAASIAQEVASLAFLTAAAAEAAAGRKLVVFPVTLDGIFDDTSVGRMRRQSQLPFYWRLGNVTGPLAASLWSLAVAGFGSRARKSSATNAVSAAATLLIQQVQQDVLHRVLFVPLLDRNRFVLRDLPWAPTPPGGTPLSFWPVPVLVRVPGDNASLLEFTGMLDKRCRSCTAANEDLATVESGKFPHRDFAATTAAYDALDALLAAPPPPGASALAQLMHRSARAHAPAGCQGALRRHQPPRRRPGADDVAAAAAALP